MGWEGILVASLLVIQGADQGKRLELDGDRHIVGRGLDSQLRLIDTEVSRHHVEFRQDGGAHKVVDLGSSNGTFVNGDRLVTGKPQALTAGDVLAFGMVKLVFHSQ